MQNRTLRGDDLKVKKTRGNEGKVTAADAAKAAVGNIFAAKPDAKPDNSTPELRRRVVSPPTFASRGLRSGPPITTDVASQTIAAKPAKKKFKSSKTRLASIEKAKAERRYDDAIRELRALIEILPVGDRLAQCRLDLAQLLYDQDRFVESQAEFAMIDSTSLESKQLEKYGLTYTRVSIALKDYDTAHKIVNQLVTGMTMENGLREVPEHYLQLMLEIGEKKKQMDDDKKEAEEKKLQKVEEKKLQEVEEKKVLQAEKVKERVPVQLQDTAEVATTSVPDTLAASSRMSSLSMTVTPTRMVSSGERVHTLQKTMRRTPSDYTPYKVDRDVPHLRNSKTLPVPVDPDVQVLRKWKLAKFEDHIIGKKKHLDAALVSAFIADNENLANILLQDPRLHNHTLTYDHVEACRPLHLAARYNNILMATHLITTSNNIPSTVNSLNSNGSPPLFYAIQQGHTDMVRLLLNHKPRLDHINHFGLSAVSLAASNNQPDIMDLLIAHGASVTTVDFDGNTPLHLAAQVPHMTLTLVNALLSAGADVNAQNKHGETALHLAAEVGQEDVVRTLVVKGVDVNVKSRVGKIALEVAMMRGHKGIVGVLGGESVKDGGGKEERTDVVGSGGDGGAAGIAASTGETSVRARPGHGRKKSIGAKARLSRIFSF